MVTDQDGQWPGWSATHHLVFTQHWWLKSSPLSKKGGWPWNMAGVVSIITNHVAKIRFMKYGWDRNHMAIIPFTPPDIGFRLKNGGLPCPTPTCKPAGGRGWWITRMEEPGGGWRLEVLNNPFIFTQRDLISINLWAVDWRWNTKHHVPVFSQIEREKIALSESKSFHSNCLISITCELWIGRLALCTSFQPSWGGRDEQNESESFMTHIDFLVDSCWEYQCLIRSWGRKYSYNDSISSNFQAFYCSQRTSDKHHAKRSSYSTQQLLICITIYNDTQNILVYKVYQIPHRDI